MHRPQRHPLLTGAAAARVPRVENCQECGFAWDEVEPASVPGRVRAAAGRITMLLAVDVDHATRPREGRWSTVEYAAHVRDVALNLRDRMIQGLAEDQPRPPSMYPAQRVDLGLYRSETAALLVGDVGCAAGIFARFTETLPGQAWRRRLGYPWPRPAERSLAWVAAQVVHELEHHGDDITANVLAGLTRVFHVADRSAWAQDGTELTGSTRGRTLQEEGFIHLATAAQLPQVLDRYFADIRGQVLVLEIDPRALPHGALRLDPVGDELFPHLYGPLPRGAVRSARPASASAVTTGGGG